MVRYTKEEKSRMLEIYSTTHKTDYAVLQIKEELGINIKKNSLVSFASKNGVKKAVTGYSSQSLISYEDVINLVRDYESGEYKLTELMKKYGYKTKKSIADKVKMYGGKMRTCKESRRIRCTYDENFMETLDEDWKAYFLGLMMTDGYVIDSRNTVGIDLIDEHTIKYLSEKTGKDYKIAKHGGKNKGKDRYRIIFTSEKLKKDIERFGITPNKSLSLQEPTLSPEEVKLMPFIIKGIIDGDGWVRKDGKEFFIGLSSIVFIEWLKDIFESFGMKNLKITTKTFDNENWNDFYILRNANQANIEILKGILKNCDIGMTYKYDRLFNQEGRSETITRESL